MARFARFAIVGIDVHRVPIEVLERIAAAGRDGVRFARRARERLGGGECAALVTCNRVELAFAAKAGESAIDAASLAEAFHAALELEGGAPPLCVRVGEAALRHLLRVACSLESAALGEEQILGQVREAIGAARAADVAGPRLVAAFDLALRVGKRVRRETPLSDLGTDLARLALRHVRTELRAQTSAPVVLVGTGAMARSILAARPKDGRDGWLVVGRDGARAAAIAREFACLSQTQDAFLAAATPIRALVAATRVERPLIPAQLVLTRMAPGAGVVDLGLPRNVEPEARTHARLADLADLRALAGAHRAQLDATIARIEGWIDEALARRRRRDGAGLAILPQFHGAVS